MDCAHYERFQPGFGSLTGVENTIMTTAACRPGQLPLCEPARGAGRRALADPGMPGPDLGGVT